MSLVFITHHNENINDIERPPTSGAKWRQTNYISKFRKGLVKEMKDICYHNCKSGNKIILSDAKKCPHKTLGLAEYPLNPPCQYLRKNEGIKWRRKPNHKCVQLGPSVPVPRHNDLTPTLKDCQCSCNYIENNIEWVKKLPTKKPPPRYIDTPAGDPRLLEEAGIVPKYVHKPKFGKVPKYIVMTKKYLDEKCRIAMEEELKRSTETFPDGIRKMNEEERLEMLAGLKINHEELEKKYYRLPIFTDTQMKKVRKSNMEKKLLEFENDIQLLENNPIVYVCEDD